ncbi:MAG: hypothetical protein HQK78_06160 [Desulfobacterales bacterium]|nr:hypothetical protein [Desulfobacterales bacterium]
MEDRSGDISGLVFKRVVKSDQGEVALSSQMLQVLMELDGKKNLGSVSKSLGVAMIDLRKIISKLYQNKLIIKVEASVAVLDKGFWDYLGENLSQAMGPIAEILIEDEIADMGLSKGKVPKSKAAEIVSLLARQIPREEKKVAFQQAMVKKLKEVGL